MIFSAVKKVYLILSLALLLLAQNSFSQGGLELNVQRVICDPLTLTYTYEFCAVAPNFDPFCVFDNGTINYSYNGGNGSLSLAAGGYSCTTVTVTLSSLTEFYNFYLNFNWSSTWTCTNSQTRSDNGSGSKSPCPEPPPLSGNSSTVDATCGNNDGEFCANGSGGTGNYSYSPSQCLSNLASGTYTITITDLGNNNTYNVVATVGTISGPSASISSTTSVSCAGGSNGTATVSASGGTPGYSYSWSAGNQTTATATGLVANTTYTVQVTDANGCTYTRTTSVTQPSALTVSTTNTSVTCNGLNNGTGSASPIGGTPGYTYSWSAGNQTTSTATGLVPATTYTVKVTDAKGCTSTSTVQVSQPTSLIGNASSNNITCFGLSNGTSTASASGGTAGYTYSWSTAGQTTATATGLVANVTYTVTISDANGCSTTATVNLTQPSALDLSINTTNTSCFGLNDGTATVNATGGVANYSYSWSAASQTSATATGLFANTTYTVQVTDANNCTATKTVIATEPGAVSLVANTTPVTCIGNGSDGTATVTTSGGTPSYTYTWSATAQTTATVSDLSVGTYTVIVNDANNCSATTTVNVTVLSGPTLTITSTDSALCKGSSTGSASVSVTGGGTSPYAYSWSTPSGATTSTVTGLAAGTYTVEVSDSAQCKTQTTVVIYEPLQMILVVSSVDSLQCNGSNTSATVTASGGTPGFSYLWSNGQTASLASGLTADTYTIVVTDENSCKDSSTFTIHEPPLLVASVTAFTDVSCYEGNNGSVIASVNGGTPGYNYSWSNGSTTSALNNLTAGSYTLHANDKYGCTDTAVVTIQQPSFALSLDTQQVTAVNCFGELTGAATVLASNNYGAVTYIWSNGLTGTTVTGLGAGTYQVTATDANLCTSTKSIVINEPSQPLKLLLDVGKVLCYGGTADIFANASGGTSGYQYQWLPGGGVSNPITGLSAGTYSLVITDSKQCILDSVITITQPTQALGITITSVDSVKCNGASTGIINASYMGGTPAYTYSWSNGQTTSSLSNVAAGTYTVIATDANFCKDTATATIGESDAINISVTISHILCYGDNAGQANAIATGGSPGYVFSWSNGEDSDSITNVIAGNYTLVVTDSRGCTSEKIVSINNVGKIVIASFDQSISFGTSPLQVNFTNYSTGASSYLWNMGDSTLLTGYNGPQHTYNLPGHYLITLLVSDSNGCADTAISNVYVYNIPNVFTPNGDNINEVFWFPNIGLEMEVIIYDRWGLKMFESAGSQIGWDGRTLAGLPASDGTYYYLLTVKHPEGKQVPNTHKGYLQLLR